ncbi:MAG: Holliday junction resolvase RuvX [Holosporaceae bacterium]|jgi:putative Holliday junction resolvase|nr:Holliday junction resolvase RuvX [Holosporaceae bacterium]
MTDFFIKKISEIKIVDLIASESVIIGLDVGDRTIGVAVSDRRIRIASGLTTVIRKEMSMDIAHLLESIRYHNVGSVIFGWPLQMNGIPGEQCKKVLEFIGYLSAYLKVCFAQWDERFSTKVIDKLMIEADLSRRKRKKIIDRNAAVYILQGAIDFLNSSNRLLE